MTYIRHVVIKYYDGIDRLDIKARTYTDATYRCSRLVFETYQNISIKSTQIPICN